MISRCLKPAGSLFGLWKEILLALVFTVFLFIFEVIYLNIEYRKYFELVTDETGLLRTAFNKLALALCLALVLMVLFATASFVSSYKFRPVYFALFSLVILVEYGYQNAQDNFMALYDLQTALTSPENWADAIRAYMNPLALAPIGLYLLLLLGSGFRRQSGWRLLLVVLAIILVVNIGMLLYSELDPVESRLHVFTSGPTLSLQAFFRTTTAAIFEELLVYEGPRDTVPFQASTRPANNIILIIDESIRYDHLGLNGYERDTSPYLEQLAAEGKLYNWGVAVAGSTCSYRSVALLLTGIVTLPDKDYQIKRRPTIFQYARAMAYNTYYFDGESTSLRFPLTNDDLEHVDAWVNQIHLGDDRDTDFRIAAQAAGLLQKSSGNFIVILKRGAHFPYNRNFPTDRPRWSPILPGEEVFSEDTGRLINSYDNSIKYNLDTFFMTLLARPDVLANTVIVYTSDHGQNLGESSSKTTHCGETKNEASVPLFIIAQPGLPVDVAYRAGHANIFPTLLDVMGYPETEQAYDYALSLLQATAANSPVRYYYHGSLFGLDEYKWLKFD